MLGPTIWPSETIQWNSTILWPRWCVRFGFKLESLSATQRKVTFRPSPISETSSHSHHPAIWISTAFTRHSRERATGCTKFTQRTTTSTISMRPMELPDLPIYMLLMPNITSKEIISSITLQEESLPTGETQHPLCLSPTRSWQTISLGLEE